MLFYWIWITMNVNLWQYHLNTVEQHFYISSFPFLSNRKLPRVLPVKHMRVYHLFMYWWNVLNLFCKILTQVCQHWSQESQAENTSICRSSSPVNHRLTSWVTFHRGVNNSVGWACNLFDQWTYGQEKIWPCALRDNHTVMQGWGSGF